MNSTTPANAPYSQTYASLRRGPVEVAYCKPTEYNQRAVEAYAEAIAPGDSLQRALFAHKAGLGQPLDAADIRFALETGSRVTGWVLPDGDRLRLWSPEDRPGQLIGSDGTNYGVVDPAEDTTRLPSMKEAVEAMQTRHRQPVGQAYLRAVRPDIMAEYDQARLTSAPQNALAKALVTAGADWSRLDTFSIGRYRAHEPKYGLRPDADASRWRARVSNARAEGIQEGLRRAAATETPARSR